MSNKNPFELRTDILAMAKDYMDKQWEANVDLTKQLMEVGDKNVKDLEQAMQPYTVDAMLDKAKEMYSFVTEK